MGWGEPAGAKATNLNSMGLQVTRRIAPSVAVHPDDYDKLVEAEAQSIVRQLERTRRAIYSSHFLYGNAVIARVKEILADG